MEFFTVCKNNKWRITVKYMIVLTFLLVSCKEGVLKEIPFVFENNKFEIDDRTILR